MKKKLTRKPTSILHEFPTVDAIKIKNGQWNVGKESCSSPMKEGTVPLENKTRNRRLLHLIDPQNVVSFLRFNFKNFFRCCKNRNVVKLSENLSRKFRVLIVKTKL